MAQCYARDAAGGSLDDTIARLKAYREEAGVDCVQFESPHSVDEIKTARAAGRRRGVDVRLRLSAWREPLSRVRRHRHALEHGGDPEAPTALGQRRALLRPSRALKVGSAAGT